MRILGLDKVSFLVMVSITSQEITVSQCKAQSHGSIIDSVCVCVCYDISINTQEYYCWNPLLKSVMKL